MAIVRQLGDRYEVGELLGRGGMAEVHVGTDTRLGRRVAIKILKSDLASDPAFLARFRREARSAASLNHPHIVAVYDTGEEILGQGSEAITVPFIVMELVEGVTLKELLHGGNPLLPERALEITGGILAALDYSHRHGIIHRDIKPGNVMVTASGVVKVMDFGIARATADAGQTGTSASTVMGTAAYLSPEQAQGRTVDARSDLYSTGVVLFELLTRRAPFIAEAPVAVAFAHVNEQAPVPSSIDPTITPSLDSIVIKAMAKDPGARYQSAVEFRADVERAMAGVPVTQVMRPAGAGSADTQATAVIAPSDPYATAVMGSAATGAMPPLAGAGAVAPPVAAGPPPKKGGRSIGLIALIVVLVGTGIWLATSLLSTSQETVQVPSLDGATVSEADSQLRAVGLTLGRQEFTPSDLPENTVISQDPRSGEIVNEGSSVNVTVSAGKEQVQVPSLVGASSADEARSALTDAGLALGRVMDEDSDQPEGEVLRQSPEAFETVDAGTSVDIWVSTAMIEVPDVVGMQEGQARSELFNAGFQVDSSARRESASEAPGTVLDQSPRGGGTAEQGSTVSLTIAIEPEPEPEPSEPEPEPEPSAPETSEETGAAPTTESASNPLEGVVDSDDDPGPAGQPTP